MIYDPLNGLLFVHIQKTAGSSITHYLAEDLNGVHVSPAHLLMKQLRFEAAQPTVFAVVRNPWARLVSWFEMMKRKGNHNSFSEYLLRSKSGPVTFSEFIRRIDVVEELNQTETTWSRIDGLLLDRTLGYQKSLSFNQVDYLTDRLGRLSVDRVLNFDHVEADFFKLLNDLGCRQGPGVLPRLNVRPSTVNWRGYYSAAEDREWVRRLYWKDIDQFGFRFED